MLDHCKQQEKPTGCGDVIVAATTPRPNLPETCPLLRLPL